MKATIRIRQIIAAICLSVVVLPSSLTGDPGDVKERMLPNGLRVLLKEVHTSPIVSVWSWYNVGSRNEGPGITGMAHLLEHMNFKGTEGISRDEMKGLIDAMGGYWNGYTWLDQTTYFETLPSSGLELALMFEAERMRRSLIDARELENERNVVISEYRGSENDPVEFLDIEVTAAAFKAHPYSWPTIGWLSDLETASRSDIIGFYNTYYIPNNATLVIVGDFESDFAMEKIEEYFGAFRVGPTPAGLRTLEPEQFGERRVTVRKRGPADYIMIAYHAPPISDEDFVPLLVLDAILAGGESINLWSIDWYEEASRSSRLYRALVEGGMASSAGALFLPTKYPFLFYMYATAMAGVSRDLIERAILAEVSRLKNDPVDSEELKRAKNQVLARYLYESDSVTEQAHQLGFFATVHEYRYAEDFPEHLEDVSSEKVQEVARKYLSADNRTIGWFVATEESRTGSIPAGIEVDQRYGRLPTFRELHAQPALPDSAIEFTPPDFSRMKPVRKVFDNGLAVVALRNPISETAHVTVTIRAGSVADPEGKDGISTLTARFLLEGAGTMTGEVLNRDLEGGGTSLSTDVGYDYATVDIDLLTKEFGDVMSMLGDIMMNPSFPGEAIDRLKKEMWTEIREEEENEYNASMMALRELIYPTGHPYARRVLGKRETLEGITVGDVKRFHEQHYYPANVSICVVGDIDPEVSIRVLEDVFRGWDGPSEPVRYDLPPVDRQNKSRVKVVSMEEKTQVSLVLGHLGIRRDNPDYVPIQIMNNILGDIGLGGRLGYRVREEMGNAYFIFSRFSGGVGQSPFFIMAGLAPEVVKETRKAILDEVERMADRGLTQEEFTVSKQNLIGSLALDLEENQGIAEILSEMEFHSLGLDYLEKYSRAISDTPIDDVQRVAGEYLDSKRYSLALAGPIDEDLNVLKPGGK